MGKSSSSLEPKKFTTTSMVSLISVFGMLTTLLLYMPIKLGIIGGNGFDDVAAYAQQQAGVATDPLSSSLRIPQSKVQDAISPGSWGHGAPSLHNTSSQDLDDIENHQYRSCNCIFDSNKHAQPYKRKRRTEKYGYVPITLIYPTHRPIQFTNTKIKFTSMDRRSYHFPEYYLNTIFSLFRFI